MSILETYRYSRTLTHMLHKLTIDGKNIKYVGKQIDNKKALVNLYVSQ